MSIHSHNFHTDFHPTLSHRDTHTSLKKTVAPTTKVVSLIEAKDHLRVDIGDDDKLINALIDAATDQVERFTRRQLLTATYELTLDRFVSLIYLPRSPLKLVNSIKYLDVNGVLTTLAATEFTVDNTSEPARVVESEGNSYPNTQREINAVIVNYDAGFGAATDVPEIIKQVILLLIHDFYENRGFVSERLLRNNKTARSLLAIYSLPRAV